MPKIKIDHVVSFSSEDLVHVANNLLNNDPAKKWKTQSVGEKSAFVILQLEKASVITGIDIGNENSAYVEVLVTRSGANDKYKVLLVMSSFMSPLESRQSTNANKVRMFGHEDLAKPESDEKWDRIKIVCTQPFNRNVQYGISFITLHSNGKPQESPGVLTLGKFVVREPSPDDISAGALFKRRKELTTDDTPTAATSIRQASATYLQSDKPSSYCTKAGPSNKKIKLPNLTASPTSAQNADLKPRNRNDLLYSEDEEKPNSKIDKIIEQKNNERAEKQKKNEELNNSNKNKDGSKKLIKVDEKVNQDKPKESPSKPSVKRKVVLVKDKSNKRTKTERKGQPFNDLLKGVALVISGITNPDRANLRSMALAMGAKYKPDWDATCSHLICAFPNTPKFHQVRGRGKIVTRKWIEDCHSQRKRLPWRRYALDTNDQGKPESEDEISEEISQVVPDDNSDSPQVEDDDGVRDEGSDTEAEIAKIQHRNRQANNNVPVVDDLDKDSDIYDADTDDEIFKKNTKALERQLPTFFANKTFFIDNDSLDKEESCLLKRYIFAYKGSCSEEKENNVDIVLTTQPDSLKILFNTSVTFIKPEWIWECHNLQKLVPQDDYVII